jgi:hypothetical protein
LQSLIEVPPLPGKQCAGHHEEEKEELGIELGEHLLEEGVEYEEGGHEYQLLLAGVLFLLIAVVRDLQRLDDEADRVDEEDEDSD